MTSFSLIAFLSIFWTIVLAILLKYRKIKNIRLTSIAFTMLSIFLISFYYFDYLVEDSKSKNIPDLYKKLSIPEVLSDEGQKFNICIVKADGLLLHYLSVYSRNGDHEYGRSIRKKAYGTAMLHKKDGLMTASIEIKNVKTGKATSMVIDKKPDNHPIRKTARLEGDSKRLNPFLDVGVYEVVVKVRFEGEEINTDDVMMHYQAILHHESSSRNALDVFGKCEDNQP